MQYAFEQYIRTCNELVADLNVCIISSNKENAQILVHSRLARPVVHNECAGMCLENVLNVVRGALCVCVVCVVLCVVVCFGALFEHCVEPFQRG